MKPLVYNSHRNVVPVVVFTVYSMNKRGPPILYFLRIVMPQNDSKRRILSHIETAVS